MQHNQLFSDISEAREIYNSIPEDRLQVYREYVDQKKEAKGASNYSGDELSGVLGEILVDDVIGNNEAPVRQGDDIIITSADTTDGNWDALEVDAVSSARSWMADIREKGLMYLLVIGGAIIAVGFVIFTSGGSSSRSSEDVSQPTEVIADTGGNGSGGVVTTLEATTAPVPMLEIPDFASNLSPSTITLINDANGEQVTVSLERPRGAEIIHNQKDAIDRSEFLSLKPLVVDNDGRLPFASTNARIADGEALLVNGVYVNHLLGVSSGVMDRLAIGDQIILRATGGSQFQFVVQKPSFEVGRSSIEYNDGEAWMSVAGGYVDPLYQVTEPGITLFEVLPQTAKVRIAYAKYDFTQEAEKSYRDYTQLNDRVRLSDGNVNIGVENVSYTEHIDRVSIDIEGTYEVDESNGIELYVDFSAGNERFSLTSAESATINGAKLSAGNTFFLPNGSGKWNLRFFPSERYPSFSLLTFRTPLDESGTFNLGQIPNVLGESSIVMNGAYLDYRVEDNHSDDAIVFELTATNPMVDKLVIDTPKLEIRFAEENTAGLARSYALETEEVIFPLTISNETITLVLVSKPLPANYCLLELALDVMGQRYEAYFGESCSE